MIALHQFVPTLEPGAVGAHTLEAQRLLRGMGLLSEIYTEFVHADYAGRGADFRRYARSRRARPGEALLYQTAIGSYVADFVLRRPEPLAVNYHNITPPEFFAAWEPGVVHGLSWGRAQLDDMADRAELGIAVSQFNERELRSAGFRETAVAPVLVDILAGDHRADQAVLSALQAAKRDGGHDLLFVGRVAPHKCQHDLVKAFAAYRRIYDPKARLHIVGASSSASYWAALRRFVAELDLTDAVRLTGGVHSAALAAHYAAADAFVCLSEHEGFCVPLVEAMHFGVPIVAFAAAAVPETLGDAGVLLPGKDPVLVAAAVHRVLTDGSVHDALVARGRDRLDRFSVERARKAFTDAVAAFLATAT